MASIATEHKVKAMPLRTLVEGLYCLEHNNNGAKSKVLCTFALGAIVCAIAKLALSLTPT